VSIILEAFSVVRTDTHLLRKEAQMASLIMEQVKSMFGMDGRKKKVTDNEEEAGAGLYICHRVFITMYESSDHLP
jgi:hypothetical protein